ncbi:MAG: hypothetical protein KBS96_02305 [Lachnospiraceae bacterium]|nr:hypothetical protein [Candidatus Colinaster scatohippi]
MIFLDSNGNFVEKNSYTADFVFVYEIQTRETNGITLIGYELVKRGYSVAYVNAWHELHRSGKRVTAKVAIVFAAYNDEVISFALSFIEKCDYALNMQWEQVLTPQSVEPGCIYILSGNAVNVHHCAWGEENVKHLTEVCGIPAENVHRVGHVGHDFVRKELDGFYRSREDVCAEFGLDPKAKLEFFIASFPPQVTTGGMSIVTDEYLDVARKSRLEIIDWFKRYHNEHKEITFIYRPHPAEELTPEFVADMEKDGAIKVIKDYSVQQWIKIADDVLIWRSTSMGDVYTAGKGCLYLTPYEIPRRYVYDMMVDADRVCSYEDFCKSMGGEFKFPISSETMNKYYYSDETPAYVRIADVLEELYKKEDGKLDSSLFKPRLEKGNRTWLDIRNLYGYMKVKLLYTLGFKKYKDGYEETKYHRAMDKRNYVSDKKTISMMKQLNSIIASNREG